MTATGPVRPCPSEVGAIHSESAADVHDGEAPRGSQWPECEQMDYRGYGGEDTFVAHPLVDGVWIGGALALDDLPEEIDEVITLGRTLKKRADDVLAYFDRPGTSNGPTKAIN